MKKEINPYIIIGGVTVVVAIIGFFAFKMFFPNPNDTPMKEGSAVQKEFEASQQQSATFQRLGGRGGRGGSGRTP
jgi:hypothetical protein